MFIAPLVAALALAAPFELRSPQPIGPIASDGGSVTFVYCETVQRWTPIRNPHPVVHGPCDPLSKAHVFLLAQAGASAAWFAFRGGNTIFMTLFARPPGEAAYPLAHVIGDAANTYEPPYVGLLGAGSSFVYTNWSTCWVGARPGCSGDDLIQHPVPISDPILIQSSTLYRLVPGSPPLAIATSDGDYDPLAFDGERIAVRRHVSGLDVLDVDGRDITSFEFGTRVSGGELDGPNVDVVVGDGEVREYDIVTGMLVATSHIPAAPGFEVTCLRVYCSGRSRLSLAGAANGTLAYLVDGNLWLLNIATGAACMVGTATSARLTSTGLFYAYTGAAPWPGRLRFLPTPVECASRGRR
jgi:hypothetical protein